MDREREVTHLPVAAGCWTSALTGLGLLCYQAYMRLFVVKSV